MASLSQALAGRYRIELGRGGMATVYLAHDERHDRPVAIKVLRPEIAAALARSGDGGRAEAGGEKDPGAGVSRRR